MAGLGDRLRERIEGSQPTTPLPEIKKDEVNEAYQSFGVVKGTLSKALSPTIKPNPERPSDKLRKRLETEFKGYSPDTPKALVSAETSEKLTKVTKPSDKLRARLEGVSLGSQQTSTGDRVLARFGEGAKLAFTALSIDEHAIVGGLYNLQGLNKKSDISDYTWTNWLKDTGYNKDLGLKDDWTTEAAGLSLSILLSPSTYLTFGATTTAKIGAKTTLTKGGMKIVNQLARAEGDKAVISAAEKAGKLLGSKAENELRQKVKSDIEQQLLKRFGEINGINKSITVSKEVHALPGSVLSKGGAKFEVPFVGKEYKPKVFSAAEKASGKVLDVAKDLYKPADVMIQGNKVLDGVEVAKNTYDSGLYHFARTVMQSKPVQGAGKAAENTYKYLGEKFVHNFGINKAMLNQFRKAGVDAEKLLENPGVKGIDRTKLEMTYMIFKWEQAETEAINLSRRYNNMTEKAFQKLGLDKTQREIFSEALIKGSVESDAIMKAQLKAGTPRDKAFAAAKGTVIVSDKKVQRAVDLWLGQGTHAGKQGIAQKLAEKSKLFEPDAGIPVWFPGIIESKLPQLKISQKMAPADRAFLAQRIDPSYAKSYTRDPVLAIGQRLNQISYANIQDSFYRKIIDQGLGGAKKVTSAAEADKLMRQGYVMLRKPMDEALLRGGDIGLERAKEATYMVKGDFYKLYRDTVTQNGTSIPILTPMTRLWKGSVTALFPAFHARNFESNVILNSYTIGGHALNPVNFKLALNMVRGKNLDKVVVTDIGEKLKLADILKEAEEIGVIKKGYFQADLAGQDLPSALRSPWVEGLKKYADPFSKSWNPAVIGRNFGEAVETHSRLINYMTWRKKGLNPRIAANEVNEALFDYHAITGFEKTLNNSFIPFYTFTRKNIEAHMKVFARRPGAITAQLKFFRDTGPTESDLKAMPDWIKNRYIVGARDNFYAGFGLPMEDLIEMSGGFGREGAEGVGRNMLLRLNPFMRYGLEKSFNKDVFANRDLKEVNAANEFKLILNVAMADKVPRFIRKPLAEISEFLKLEYDPSQPDKVIGDPNKLHILRSGFTSRFQSTIGQLSKADKTGLEKAMQGLLGVVRIEKNEEMQVAILKRKATEKLKAIALETNLARPINLPWFYGDEDQAEIANQYMQELSEATTPEEVNQIIEEMGFEAVEEQKVRTEINLDPL